MSQLPELETEQSVILSSMDEFPELQPGVVQEFDGSRLEDEITELLRIAIPSGNPWPKAWAFMKGGSDLWGLYEHASYQSNEESKALVLIAHILVQLIMPGATILDNGSWDLNKAEPFINALERVMLKCRFVGFDIARTALENGLRRLSSSLNHVQLCAGWGGVETGKQFLASVPGQRVLFCMGSTFSNDCDRFHEAVASARPILRNENDIMIIGQDCHMDHQLSKLTEAYESPAFENFIEGSIERADQLLGLDGPATKRWGFRHRWAESEGVTSHVNMVYAKENITWEAGTVEKGTEREHFASHKFPVGHVLDTFKAHDLRVHHWRIGDGSSYIFLARPYPVVPEIPAGVRFAEEKDIPRMVDVSVAGFRNSEIFRYNRRYYEQYPDDARASLTMFYRERLPSKRSLCAVQEDPNGTVVGLVMWDLPEDSPRVGQFSVPVNIDPIENLKRDEDHGRRKYFTAQSAEKAEQHFKRMWICNKFVVHPDFQKKGYGRTLLDWTCLIADMDGFDQGVIPSHRGNRVYKAHGFEKVAEMVIDGDANGEGFTQEVCRRLAPRPLTERAMSLLKKQPILWENYDGPETVIPL